MDSKNDIINELNIFKKYNNSVYAKTKEYQNKYGFQIGKGKNDTWNNEADAFKHTYMQAQLSLYLGQTLAKMAGDYHEWQGHSNGQPQSEENMDRWNNQVGREIAEEIIKEYGPSAKFPSEKINDIIAEKVMQKMNAGKLITNPKDKRKYIEGKVEVNVDLNHTFTRDEIDKMSIEEYQKNEKGIPTQQELEKTKSENHSGGSGKWVTINGNHVLLED